MHESRYIALRTRQRGWAGMLGLLLALVVVGLLFRTVLRQMGLTDGAPSAIVTGRPAATAGAAATAATPEIAAPRAPSSLERARALEGDVMRQAQDRAQKLDALAR